MTGLSLLLFHLTTYLQGRLERPFFMELIMPIKDLTPPSAEPINLDYAKIFLRVDTASEDALIADLIVSARMRVEQMIRASLITRRHVYATDKLSDAGLYINHGPVTAVHEVRAVNKEGEETILAPTDYRVDLRSVPARICLVSPRRFCDYGAQSVEAELDAGYGAAASDVPMPLRQAVMLLLAQSYEHRDKDSYPPVPMMVDALLMPYRSLKL